MFKGKTYIILMVLLSMGIIYEQGTSSATPLYFSSYFPQSGSEDSLEHNNARKRILKVPSEYPTIAEAVADANESDWIIISPGSYAENEIEIKKGITVSSEWKLSGDESIIYQTIIDAEDKRLFIINADDVEISGLMIINGDHTLDISSKVTISHNHFINNLDGMSFESGGGGYAGYNIAENDRDDALDSDIISERENAGSDILIEHNLFINSHDDGIEVRLFKPQNQNIHYTIRNNQIIGSNNAGIQLISYDEFTGKVFDIHHNIFMNCKTGLGCMEGAKTREDLSGASKMDEQVIFYNNTITDCQMGATGGNNIQAFNNLVLRNSSGGFKRFGANSGILNNLFYQNGGDDLVEIDPAAVQLGNIFSSDPMLDENSLYPAENSPVIDAGLIDLEIDGTGTLRISHDKFTGEAPDIGACERGLQNHSKQSGNTWLIDAGQDRVIESGAPGIVLAGRMWNADGGSFNYNWKQENGPAGAEILNPDKLVTRVNLKQEGIYRFSVDCSDERSSSSDFVTIRYIHDGEGKQLFINGEKTDTIEAEEFAYTYGTVKKVGRKYFRLDGNVMESGPAQMEFTVGTADPNEFELWILIKSPDPGQKKLLVSFNQKYIGDVSTAGDKRFHWVKLPGKVAVTPGQWQLLITNNVGVILLDKIIFSVDSDFIP